VHASGTCATASVLAVLGAPSTPADIATTTPPVCDRLQASSSFVLGGPRCWPPGREFPDIRGPRRGKPRRQRHQEPVCQCPDEGLVHLPQVGQHPVRLRALPQRLPPPGPAPPAGARGRPLTGAPAPQPRRAPRMWLRSAAAWRAMANASRAGRVGAPSIPPESGRPRPESLVSPASQDCSACWSDSRPGAGMRGDSPAALPTSVPTPGAPASGPR